MSHCSQKRVEGVWKRKQQDFGQYSSGSVNNTSAKLLKYTAVDLLGKQTRVVTVRRN